MRLQTIKDCKQIDLDKHALVEASAGTGKTFTIENLVVRMLVENETPLEKILLVTFTEKATGELKKRIREKIESASKNDEGDKKGIERLRNALVNFDSAAIYTIHGFCQSILKDYSFENSQLFDFEIAADEPLYERLLYEQMRKSWHKEFGGNLSELLEASDFPGVNRRKGESQWINKVVRVAQAYYHGINNRIAPEIPDDVTLAPLKEQIVEQLHDILKIVGHIDKDNMKNSDLYRVYNDLNFHETRKQEKLKNIILPLLNFLSDFKDSHWFNINNLCNIFDDISLGDYKKRGIACLIPEEWKKGGSNLLVKCRDLGNIASLLDQIIKTTEIIRHILTVKCIRQLGRDVSRYKTQNGFISFNDMLSHVVQAIRGDNSKHLLKNLRTKYRYAIVDEFQDTDAIQWEIFSEIFINGNEQRLFLIGDPKQAIYSFRGADIYAYFEARETMVRLAGHEKAMLYSLETNWRSGPRLINAFNHLFEQDDWFRNEDADSNNGEYAFRHVKPSDRVNDALSDETERAPFTVVNIDDDKGSMARRKMAEFTAYEIGRLANSGRIKDEDEDRILDYGDMCILVRNKSEIPVIEKELNVLNIPHTYYKKPGLYQSDEAMELLFLFRCIEAPDDESSVKKGLLTPFFGIAVEDLHNYDNINSAHPLKILIGKWHEYALYGKWPLLFQSIIEDSGLLVRELQKSGSERRLTNYRHIVQNLEQTAYERSLDFTGIINCLESLRSQVIEVEAEMDLHRIESERSKVKIMTIHSSKGLEFPIVFLLGGFTKSVNPLFYKYHENGTVVYDLTKSNNSKEKHRKEEESEDRRLYYVALTRAKYRVYLPEHRSLKTAAGGVPIADFIYGSIQSMKNTWKDENRKECLQFIDIKRAMHDTKEEKCDVHEKEAIDIPNQIFPPEGFDFRQRRTRIESFTSIIQKRNMPGHIESPHSGKIIYHDTAGEKGDDETVQITEDVATDETPGIQELPRGRHVGNMFHEILENIDFSTVAKAKREERSYDCLLKDTETASIIEERLAFNRIGNEHNAAVAKIIWNTLVAPLSDVCSNFTLSNLGEKDKIHEMEFYYPAANSGYVILPEDIVIKNGFYTGFIDMIFCYEGRYFIVDWKSNYIADGYSRRDMERSMDESNYHLQRRIYTEALILWLRQCLGDRFDYKKNFGGAFYLFLRGIGAVKGNGVYYWNGEKSNIGKT